MNAGRFRKKSVVIDAMEWPGGADKATLVIDWILDGGGTARYYEADYLAKTPEVIEIDTLEGTMQAQRGDWVIRGVKGEFYPCKPDIFEATYDADVTYSNEDPMTFRKFVRKPFVVEALQITEDNIEELSELIGEYGVDKSGPFIMADPERVPTVDRVVPGYWVTKMGKNVRCYSDKVFSGQFIEGTPSVLDGFEAIVSGSNG